MKSTVGLRSVVLSMNYRKIHDSLISRARERVLDGCVEKHHVLPKCMGGTDDRSNIVRLTPEEHYVIHQLLVRLFPHVSGLVTAALRMAKQCSGNKAYGWIRRRCAKNLSLRTKGKKKSAEHAKRIGDALRGRVFSATHRAALRKSNLGKTRSAETKLKLSIALGRRNQTPEARRRSSETAKKYPNPFLGRKHTEETKAKMSAGMALYWRGRREAIAT